jgi:2'-5' RNA ligase
VRAFLALEIRPATRASLGEVIRRLRPHTLRVRWVDPAQMHLTLVFFDDLPPGKLEAVTEAAAAACGRFPPITLQAKGLGYFGQGDRMRVLWCGLSEPTGTLALLRAELQAALEPLGFAPERRPFSPHLTLGRLREPSREFPLRRELEGMAAFEAAPEVADHLTLFESTLTPRGPLYTVRGRWPLGGTP